MDEGGAALGCGGEGGGGGGAAQEKIVKKEKTTEKEKKMKKDKKTKRLILLPDTPLMSLGVECVVDLAGIVVDCGGDDLKRALG